MTKSAYYDYVNPEGIKARLEATRKSRMGIKNQATNGWYLTDNKGDEVYLSPTTLDPTMTVGILMNSTVDEVMAYLRLGEFLRWWHHDSRGNIECGVDCRICEMVQELHTQAGLAYQARKKAGESDGV